MKTPYVSPDEMVAHYTCCRTPIPLSVDGDLEKPAWRAARKSARFVDLVSGEPAFFDTRVACLWDEHALYVAFWIEEPQVRATLKQRDSFVWMDNDVEVFLGGEDCYYECEINALGTLYEVFFIYQDALKKAGRFDRPEFDLYARDVDVLGGFQDASRCGKDSRGKRWAFMDWDYPGLQSAVRIDGRLNDPQSIDKGWTVELAFPWAGMQILFADRVLPPREGDILRAQFFRFEALRYHDRTVAEHPGWALNAHGVYDSHIPGRFAFLHFTESPV
ncbi:MAG TPA: carbohydrate-binding family 9-like protein [Opitutus sp.]|nr:carbohydrate-binding family 9-like protein [Opitutus sp.]